MKFSSNSFTYSKEQIVHLAGWYGANAQFGHGFSTALEYAVTSPDERTAPIWPDADVGIVVHIARLLEIIERVHCGEKRIWWHGVPKKTNSPNEVDYITYSAENWIREGFQWEPDPELEEREKFKPDYILRLDEGTRGL